jgi:hypothetical protein
MTMWNTLARHPFSADNHTFVRLVPLWIAERAWLAYLLLSGAFAKRAGTLSKFIETAAPAFRAYLKTVYPVCILA